MSHHLKLDVTRGARFFSYLTAGLNCLMGIDL
jgi:hypothetical protein